MSESQVVVRVVVIKAILLLIAILYILYRTIEQTAVPGVSRPVENQEILQRRDLMATLTQMWRNGHMLIQPRQVAKEPRPASGDR